MHTRRSGGDSSGSNDAPALLPLQLPTRPASSLRVRAVAVLRGHGSRVWCVAWSPTAAHVLASSSADCTVKLWGRVRATATSTTTATTTTTTFTYACLATLAGEHARTVRHVSWSPSGDYLACASFDHTATVWRRVQQHDEDDDDDDDDDADDDSSNRHHDKTASASARVVDFEVEGVLDGHESEVKCVSWLTDSTLATCARDHNVWVWDRVDEGEYECAGILTGHRQDVKHCLWLLPPPSSSSSAAALSSCAVTRDDDDDDNVAAAASQKSHTTTTTTTRPCVLSCSYDNTIRVWTDAQRQDDWQCVQTLTQHTATVWSLALQRVELTLRDVRDADAHGAPLPHPLLCSCADDGSVRFWRRSRDTTHFMPAAVARAVCARSIYAVDWAPHGAAVVACACGDNSIALLSLWQANDNHHHNNDNNNSTGSDCHDTNTDSSDHDDDGEGDVRVCVTARVADAHEADVNSVSFAYTGTLQRSSNDDDNNDDDDDDDGGVLLASGGDDATVRIWLVTSLCT